MNQLQEIKKGIEACRTYNFGMRYADKLAHEDADKLVAALEVVEAMLAEHATQHRAVSDLLNQQVMDREPHRDPEAASRYAHYATSWEAAQRMARHAITEALA